MNSTLDVSTLKRKVQLQYSRRRKQCLIDANSTIDPFGVKLIFVETFIRKKKEYRGWFVKSVLVEGCPREIANVDEDYILH